MKRLVCAAIGLAMSLSAPWTARADGSGPDGEPPRPRDSRARHGQDSDGPETRPARRVTGSPDYVGSAFGLGKPSYYGIGTGRTGAAAASTDAGLAFGAARVEC